MSAQKSVVLKAQRVAAIVAALVGLVLLFDAVQYQYFDPTGLRYFALLLCAIALIACVSAVILKVRLASTPVILIAVFTAVMLLGLVYASSPSMAYDSVLRYVSAFAAFMTFYVLIRLSGSGATQNPESARHTVVKPVFWMILLLLSVQTVLSLDAASTQIIIGPVLNNLAEQSATNAELYGAWTGSRMMTLLNANVTAPLNFIGIFIAGYLYSDTESRKIRAVILTLAILLALGFYLCVSLGTIIVGSVCVVLAILISGARVKTLLYYLAVFAPSLLIAIAVFWAMGQAAPLGFVADRFTESGSSLGARLEFDRDAFMIGVQSPLIGFGGGAFETKAMLVQQSYYETKFVHNNYLQVFVEAGIVGTISYLSVLGYALFLLLKRMRAQLALRNALLPALVLVLLHTAVDFEMSFEFFMVVFYILLAVIAVCAQDIEDHLLEAGVRSATALILLVTIGLCLGTNAGQAAISDAVDEDGDVELEQLTDAVTFAVAADPLHAADYKLYYVSMLTGEEVPAENAQLAAGFVRDLDAQSAESAEACKALVDYYFYNGDLERALYYVAAMTRTRPHDPAIYETAEEIRAVIEEAVEGET